MPCSSPNEVLFEDHGRGSEVVVEQVRSCAKPLLFRIRGKAIRRHTRVSFFLMPVSGPKHVLLKVHGRGSEVLSEQLRN